MECTLPKHLLKSLKDNKTSLGEHPCYPPEEEEKFIINKVNDTFSELCEKNHKLSYEELKSEISRLYKECKEIERNNIGTLEKLCVEVVNKIFDIPTSAVVLECNIVDTIDTTTERFIPEKTKDYTFDSIEDMVGLTDEVYKRRMLNALVMGASMHYSSNNNHYIKQIFDIDTQLPSLYKKLIDYNNLLIYYEKDIVDEKKTMNGGKVNVYISSEENIPIVKSEGVLFPVLLQETIKGILELSVSHGLPENKEKAKYVMSKSDFKLAELWDMRLGYALWNCIEKLVDKLGYNLEDVGLNYFLMELSEQKCVEFNKSLQEIFGSTKQGENEIKNLVSTIMYSKEYDEFSNYTKTQSDELLSSEDGYFTSQELDDLSKAYL